MRFYLKVFAAVLVAVAVGYVSTAAHACPQNQCFQQQQNIRVQRVTVPQQVIVQQQEYIVLEQNNHQQSANFKFLQSSGRQRSSFSASTTRTRSRSR